jgi:hypothetical protein
MYFILLLNEQRIYKQTWHRKSTIYLKHDYDQLNFSTSELGHSYGLHIQLFWKTNERLFDYYTIDDF